jgi:hypothetical protein
MIRDLKFKILFLINSRQLKQLRLIILLSTNFSTKIVLTVNLLDSIPSRVFFFFRVSE